MGKKVLVVVDISNIFYCVKKKFNDKIDYGKLLDEVVRDNESLHRAIAYGAQIDNDAANFVNFLNQVGFETKYKEPKVVSRIPDPRDPTRMKEIRKADWDVGMTMDVVKILDQVDVVVFCTADGDMAPCVEYVQSRGKEARVLGCTLSYELKAVCHNCQEIQPHLLMGSRLETSDEPPKATESVELRDSVAGDAAPSTPKE